MALALVLLIGSGLMVRTFQSMRKVNPGFSQPEELQTFRISNPRNAATKDAEVLVMQQSLVERLAALPGITEASLIDDLPMTGALVRIRSSRATILMPLTRSHHYAVSIRQRRAHSEPLVCPWLLAVNTPGQIFMKRGAL